jgi:hypothetical protein
MSAALLDFGADGTCVIDRKLFRAIAQFVSTDPTRETLAKMWFEPAERRVVATDGNTLVVVTATYAIRETHQRYAIGLAEVKDLASKQVRGDPHRITPDSSTEPYMPPIDQITPGRVQDGHATKAFGIDLRFLTRVHALAKAVRPHEKAVHGQGHVMIQTPDAPWSPMRVDFEDVLGVAVMVVIMPVRL